MTPDRKPLVFYFLDAQLSTGHGLAGYMRAKIPGGWLIVFQNAASLGGGPESRRDASGVFVPDPLHEWDGGSLP